ncbi:MAG: helix-turn-helix domain-containing protein [Eubacteriales bacterium]|nr:helix-turn-helix domain-containing protein [Eubacteriales bacterium]
MEKQQNPLIYGSMRTYVDEDMKQSIILNLLEMIPDFPLEEAERIAEMENADN